MSFLCLYLYVNSEEPKIAQEETIENSCFMDAWNVGVNSSTGTLMIGPLI